MKIIWLIVIISLSISYFGAWNKFSLPNSTAQLTDNLKNLSSPQSIATAQKISSEQTKRLTEWANANTPTLVDKAKKIANENVIPSLQNGISELKKPLTPP